MWLLIMIVALNGQGKAVDMSSNFYETERACKQAATEFESHKGELILKAFCIRGD